MVVEVIGSYSRGSSSEQVVGEVIGSYSRGSV